MSNGVTALSGKDSLRSIEAVVHAYEALTVGIKTAGRCIYGIEGIMVATLAVFRLVVDDSPLRCSIRIVKFLYFHLTCVEVALEVLHIGLCVPQAPLHKEIGIKVIASCYMR